MLPLLSSLSLFLNANESWNWLIKTFDYAYQDIFPDHVLTNFSYFVALCEIFTHGNNTKVLKEYTSHEPACRCRSFTGMGLDLFPDIYTSDPIKIKCYSKPNLLSKISFDSKGHQGEFRFLNHFSMKRIRSTHPIIGVWAVVIQSVGRSVL